MQQALVHRGPDAHDSRRWAEAALVHTRLSILDLSANGVQPMSNEDGTVWTVFNGEIYNHWELRSKLEERGHCFRGTSDTEVLPHLYEEYGPDFVSSLKGMFALAIYDLRGKSLFLSRDRYGIKPLFFAPTRERLYFASEINALRAAPGVDFSPDPQAIHDFAALFYIPAPETFFKGIRVLEPGQILEAKLCGHGIEWKTRPFHRWAIVQSPELTLQEAADRAEALTRAAVKSQLESDVPLGAFLSGGIDSSLVSAAAQTQSRAQLQTFNVRFPESGYDETWAAQAVSQHIGSRHQTLDLHDTRGSWEEVTGVLRHAGQPFADTSVFAVSLISQLIRQHVTVALSGDGGDEGFGGYPMHSQIALIDKLQKWPRSWWRAVTLALAPLSRWGVVPSQLSRRVEQLSSADDPAIIQILRCWIRDPEHAQLCRARDVLPVRRHFEAQWECHFPKRASRLERLSALGTEVDTRLLLPNDLLFKVDIASMRESLEVRVPMLDEELFEFGLALPHHLKVKAQETKRVLREVAARQLPATVASRPKHGFDIPIDGWVNQEFKLRLKETLLGGKTRLPEVFCPATYRPWLEAFCAEAALPGISRQSLYQRAIMLLSLHLALEL